MEIKLLVYLDTRLLITPHNISLRHFLFAQERKVKKKEDKECSKLFPSLTFQCNPISLSVFNPICATSSYRCDPYITAVYKVISF